MTAQDLKNSVLQRAMQGKLVEQRAEEGTAKELIGQIRIEKDNLIKEGKIRKEKILPKISDEEIPFEIPESWEWVRLETAFVVEMGQSPDGNSVSESANGMEFHQGKVFFSEKIIKHSNQTTSAPTKIAESNSVLLCVRAPVGKVNITDRKLCIGRGLCAIKPLAGMTVEFAFYLLETYEKIFVKKATGTTFVAITAEVVKKQLVPIPPLAEQKRIVAKIEELLPYIEKYDKAYSKLTVCNKKFPEDMQKSILQYAMQGKLVEQRIEEGTGEELYCHIQAEKEKLIKDGKIKKEKRLPEILENEIPFDIPKSWKWVKLNSIVTIITDGDHQPPPQVDTGIPFLVISNMSQGNLSFINTRNVSQEYYDNLQEARKPQSGDILFTVTGSYGIVILVKTDKKFCVQRHIAIIKKPFVSADYLVKCLSAPFSYKQCKEKATGTAQKTVGLDTLRNLILPLPPLAEQERIVEELGKVLQFFNKN